ncbi:MAG: hypothetical protein ACQEP6_00320 [Patescibacteria group bacterium]
MTLAQNVKSFKTEPRRVVVDNIEEAKLYPEEGLVFRLKFKEFPLEITKVRGRKILYQELYNFPEESAGESVYLIPSDEVYKLKGLYCSEKELYQILEKGGVSVEGSEPNSIKILISKGLFLRKIK